MNMKLSLNKTTLLLLACALPSHGESFSAKRTGQGFTSITQDFTSAISNPALLSKYDNDDDAYFSLNLGVIGSDEYDVIDTGEAIADDIDALGDDIDNIENIALANLPEYVDGLDAQVDTIVADLNSIDDKIVNVREGVNMQVIIPNKHLSFGLFANQYGRLGIAADFSQNDEQVMRNAIINGNLNTDDLNSTALGVGYSVLEAGVMMGYQVIDHVNYELSLGAKLKYQRLDLFHNNISITDFDNDEFDITDDENLIDVDGTNIDLGLYTAWGEQRQWHFALVANNLKSQKVTLATQGISFEIKTAATAGLSYQNDWLTLATEIDLTDREQFLSIGAAKYAAIGAEFRLYEHAQFRIGARTDLNDNEADIYTLGLGLSPWDVISFDIAAFTGDNDNIGAALEIGIKL